MSWHRVVSFILCGIIFYDAIIDHIPLFYDIITQIKPLLEFVPFVLLMSFVSQKHLIVNLLLYVIKLYNRATKNMTSEIYVLKNVITYE